MGITSELSRFSAEISLDHLPAPVVERARFLVLDLVGNIVRARHDAESTASFLAATRAMGLAAGNAGVFGDASRYTPAGAAFLNGALAHSLDFDDTHAAGSRNGLYYEPLEIAYRLSQASMVWVFSLIYLLLGIGILSSSWLFWKDEQFGSKSQAILGVALAISGFLAFTMEVSMFFNPNSYALRAAFAVMTLLWGVILLPVWLVLLGYRLGSYVEQTQGELGGNREVVEMEDTKAGE